MRVLGFVRVGSPLQEAGVNDARVVALVWMGVFMVPFLFLAWSQASAFCGTYVSAAGTEVYNSASEVVLVRQGTRTTLTMANDIVGTPSDFAMVVPVPQVVRQDDVHVVDPADIDLLRTYSTPRLVEYKCSDFAPYWEHPCPWMEQSCPSDLPDTYGVADSGGEGEGEGEAGTGSVAVEARYIVGEYSIVVLSAEQSADLLTWLEAEGYAVPESTANLLQQYIDEGSYFLAAQIDEGADLQDGDSLSPLQFAYDSEAFGLPIRLGTASSTGEQDLIIHAVTDLEEGAVGISNFPERGVEDECMWDPTLGSGEFGDFYAEQFTQAYEDEPGLMWTTEYAWKLVPEQPKCDPCTGPPPEQQELTNLGFVVQGAPAYHITRLHARYTPDEATQDLMLYTSRQHPQSQVRYIQYKEEMEDRYPLCGSGWEADPATCSFEDPYADTECLTEEEWADDCERHCGCSTRGTASWGVSGGLGLLGLMFVGWRRR